MANGELADHERALGPNFTIGFEGDVHELHGAYCPRRERTSANGTIPRANRAELQMLGYSAEEYVGRSIVDFHADRETIEDILSLEPWRANP